MKTFGATAVALALCLGASVAGAQEKTGSPPATAAPVPQAASVPPPATEPAPVAASATVAPITTAAKNDDVLDRRAQLDASRTSARAAVAMAVIGAGQLLLFLWQLGLMRSTVRDSAASAWAARAAAEAASLNARAAIGIELPLITASVFGLMGTKGPTDPYDPPGGTVNYAYPGRFSSVGPITFKNSGRTPANLDLLELGWMVANDLPDVPRYRSIVALEHFAMIGAGEEFQVPYHVSIELTDEEQSLISAGAALLWFYGSLRYTDFLGDTREARFCVNYNNRPRGNLNPFGFYSDGRPPKAYTAQTVSRAL